MTLSLFTVGFGRSDLLTEQKRLLDKNLRDSFKLTLLDNTPIEQNQLNMRNACERAGVTYVQVISEKHEHPDALKLAAEIAVETDAEYWGCLDHDIFPTKPVEMIPLIQVAGFYGLSQTYTARMSEERKQYLWPGWCFFSRDWLAGRVPDFYGIRGGPIWDHGDAGSNLHSLFTPEDWARLPARTHEYRSIREEDGAGLQSYGMEVFDGAWTHFTNASNWKAVPRPNERTQLLLAYLRDL